MTGYPLLFDISARQWRRSMNEYVLIIGLVLFGAGFAIAFWLKGKVVSQKVKAAEEDASRILNESRRQAETLLKEADLEVKERLLKMKGEFDAETKETRAELKKR
jgi:ribonuclease Y